MLSRLYAIAVLELFVTAGCVGPSSQQQPEPFDTSSSTTSSATTSGLSSSESGASSGAETSSTGSSSGSSSGDPVDPCGTGPGSDWPQRGAYLKLATEEDFSAGPLELSCSIDRTLEANEFESLLPAGVVGALALTCEVPHTNGETSEVYVATTIPGAVARLGMLVGLEGVSVLFHYGGSIRGKPDPGFEATVFGIRDEMGPLMVSQEVNCDGQVSSSGLTCSFFPPPFQVSPTWALPLPEGRLADVGCGTRPWDWNFPPMPGTYDMTRLAVRFDTDDGVVDALDHHITPMSIEGNTYEFFAVEVVGEVDDPSLLFDTSSYTHFVRFLIIRTP